MRKIKLELSSGKSEVIEVPLTLYDLNTATYQRIVKEWNGSLAKPQDAVRLFALLTGKDYKDYIDSKDSNIAEVILRSIKFLVDNSVELNALPMPEYFHGHRIPKDFGKLTLGQNLQIRAAFKDVKSDYELVSFIIAVAMQPIIDGGTFNDDRLDFYKEQFDMLPITTTYPIASFLFSLQKSYGQHGIKNLVQTLRTTAGKLNKEWRLRKRQRQNS